MLNALIASILLDNAQYEISWSLEPSGRYSVNSLYNFLSQWATIPHYRVMWEVKLPLKIKVFFAAAGPRQAPFWHANYKSFWPLDGRCALCGALENASHIFFECSLAKFSWSVLRQAFGKDRNPTSFAHFFAILAPLSGHSRTLL